MSCVFKFSVHNTCNSSHYYFAMTYIESDVDSVWGNYCLLTWIQYTECVEPQSSSLVDCSPTWTILIYSTTGQRYRYSGIIRWNIQFYTARTCVEPQSISLVSCSPTWTTDLEHNWLEIPLQCYHTVEIVHRSTCCREQSSWYTICAHKHTQQIDLSLSQASQSLMHSRDLSLSQIRQS